MASPVGFAAAFTRHPCRAPRPDRLRPVGVGYRLAKAAKSGLAGREGGQRLAGIVAALDQDGDRTGHGTARAARKRP